MNIDTLGKVYQMLQDDYSREIYENRVLFSLTNNDKYIDKLAYNIPPIQWLKHRLEKFPTKKVLLYGAGIRGKRISGLFPDMFTAFVDNDINKQGITIDGLSVIPVSDIKKSYKDAVVVVSNKHGFMEIKNNLIDCGIKEDRILNLGEKINSYRDAQYFDLEKMKAEIDEVFVDCGAFNGDSAFAFMNWADKVFKHIYCYEPDKKNYMECKNNLKNYIEKGNVSISNNGIWNSYSELNFSDTADVASHVCEDGIKKIEAVSLDDDLLIKRNEKVTFIKMDIEGAEMEALKGAKQIIKRQKPKLAICVYHKPEDIFEIPQYIMSLNPEYKFYLRHYTLSATDTILYAIP